MEKTSTRKPHAPKRRRRVRHTNPAFPPTSGVLSDIVETMAGMALVDMVRRMGISPTQVLLTVRALSANKPPSSAAGCVCKGECLCHTGVQIAAVSCPPDCPNIGTRFDGCHRCDCGSKEH